MDNQNNAWQNEFTFTPPPKKKKIKWWLLIPAIVVTAAVLAAVAILLVTNLSQSPLEKTVKAVFPSYAVLDKMQDGGSINVEGVFCSDIIEELKDEPLHVALRFDYNQNAAKISGNLGLEDSRVDALLLIDQKGFELGSDALLEKNYDVTAEGLIKAIDASPFAPESGTAYAMSQDTYQQIKDYLDSMEDNEKATEILTTAMENIFAELEDEITVETSKETVKLKDGKTNAKVTEIPFDEKLLAEFFELLEDEWEDNDDLHEWILQMMKDSDTYEEDDEDSLEEYVEDEFEYIHDFLKELEIDGTFRYAVKGGYLVLAELEIEMESDDSLFETLKFDFSCVFTEKPKKDPSFELELALKEGKTELVSVTVAYEKTQDGDETSHELEFVTNTTSDNHNDSTRVELQITQEKNDDFQLTCTVSSADGYTSLSKAKYEEDLELSAEGAYSLGRNKLSLRLDELSYTSYGEKVKMKDSEFTVTLSAANPWLKRSLGAKDMTDLTAEESAEIEAAAQEKMAAFAEELNKGLGVEALRYDYEMETKATFDRISTTYAYDSKTNQLFVFGNYNKETGEQKIYAYNAATFRKTATIVSDQQNTIMAASNGKLAIGSDNRKTVAVYNTETLELINTVSLQDKPTYLAMDGDCLLSWKNNSIYRTDLSTGECSVLMKYGYYDMELDIDPINHAVCVAVFDSSINSKAKLSFYSTTSGELLAETSFAIAYDAESNCHFNGTVFSVNENLYRWNGEKVTKKELAPNAESKTYNSWDSIRYADNSLIVSDEETLYGTEAYWYAVDSGKAIGEDLIPFESVLRVIKISEYDYLVIEAPEEGGLYFYTVSVKKTWLLEIE